LDVATNASWIASSAFSSNPISSGIRGVMAGISCADDYIRYKRDKDTYYKGNSFDKYSVAIWALTGSVILGLGITDILNGKIEQASSNISYSIPFYLEAISKGIHYIADKRKTDRV